MKIIEVIYYGIFIIFFVFSAILLAGFVQIIFFNWTPPEIYKIYLASVIGESIVLLFLYIKNIAGLRQGVRKVYQFDKVEKINNYMLNLVSRGSSLDIVSGTLSWVSGNPKIEQKLIERAKKGQVNIYLPKKNLIATKLENNGATVTITSKLNTKKAFARFTVVNKAHPGSTMLAVGCGVLPKFIISEFDAESNSQVVALALDYLGIL